MQLRVVHRTRFAYEGAAAASYNHARLTPLTSPHQLVVHARVDVVPQPWSYTYRDWFGTVVTGFEIAEPHEQMTVTATSTVHTQPRPPHEVTLSWDDLAAPEVADRWTEYLQTPPLVEAPADLLDRVRALAAEHERPGDAAAAVCLLVGEEVAYVPGATDVSTPAAEAWRRRAGVCQDMVHLAIGCLRALGIPARYVSGYVHPDAEPAVGAVVTGESHAWLEWWDEGWQQFDPTHRDVPADRYVVVGVGRDYDDVPPLRGVYSGAATAAMEVSVEITRLA